MHASTADLRRMRLLAHGLAAPVEVVTSEAAAGAAAAADVVRRLLAVQAQDFGAACWALGARAPGITLSDVLAALDSGQIVRSWPMRGTLHFVPPADLGWLLELTTERLVAGLALRQRRLGLDAEVLGRARDVVTDALVGGRSIGRAEVMQLWEDHGIVTEGQRGYHLIYYLAQTGVLCWGPTHRTQQALVLLEEWVPNPRLLDRDEALGEVLLRYVQGHGPATLKDLVWWTKGTVADARRGLAVAGDALTSVEVDGVEHWVPTALADQHAARHPTSAETAVQLLPAFDEYLLGYQNRAPVIDAAHFETVVPGGNGVFAPVIVSRGRVVGTWKRSATATSVTVTAQPFGALTRAETSGVARGAQAYGTFLGLTGTAG